MASRGINVLISLVDKFTAPLKKPVHATQEMQRQVKKASNQLSSFGKGANARFLSITSSIGTMTAGLTGIGAILSVGAFKHFADEAMELAAHQEEAEVKLETILKNVKSIQTMGGDAVKRTKEELVEYAGKLQSIGVIGDEVTLSGMQQLATFQLNGEQIKTLSGGMLDLLVQQKGLNATQEDAVGIANLIGKAMMGNAGALSRVGITLSDAEKQAIKFGDSNQRAAIIAQILQNNVGGVNKALAETPDGKIQQAQNAYGDMLEVMGGKLVKIKAVLAGTFFKLIPVIQEKLGAVFDVLVSKLDVFAVWVAEHGNEIVNGLSVAFNAIVQGITIIGTVIDVFIQHSNVLIPLLSGIVAGFVAFNVISKVVAVFTLLKTAMQGAQIGMAAFNAVMAANPIVLIALAIAALIALIVALIMHWDEVKAVVIAFGEYCSAVINDVMQWFTELGNAIVDAISSAIDSVIQWFVELGNAIVNAIANAIKMAVDWFNNMVNDVITAINQIIVGVTEAINNTIQGVITLAQTIITIITDVIIELVSGWVNMYATIYAVLTSVMSSMMDWFVQLGTSIFNTIMFVVDTIYNFVATVYEAGYEAVMGFINQFSGLQDSIAQIFQGIIDFVTGIFTGNWDQAISGLVSIFTGYFNAIKAVADGILGAISEKIANIGNGLSTVKSFIFGDESNNEHHNATGTGYWQGGSTYVNENNRGEEIVLPSGTQIIPHDEAVKRASNRSSDIKLYLTIQGNVIGNEEFMEQCGRYITDKVRLAMNNM